MATIDNRLRSVNSIPFPVNGVMPYAWAASITAAVAGPWLVSGYIFGTDWPGPRHINPPVLISSLAPIQIVLAALAALVSAEVAAKLLLMSCLFVAAIAAFWAVPYGDFIPRASASLIYVLNPFVYGRLHYGQFYVLAAYAVLPWVALRIYRLVASPSVAKGLLLAAGFVVMTMFAVHFVLVGLLLLGVASLCAVAGARLKGAYASRLGVSLAATAVATLILSSYWLIPYVAGGTYESQVISRIGTRDLAAYSAVGDPSAGLAPNLLGLYGFWAEAVHRFPSLKLFVPGWELVMIAVLVLSAIGIVYVFIVRDETLRNLRWWVTALVIAGFVGLILEAGVAEPHVAPFIRWLDTVFPPYRGMRDSGKWASLLALVYAQLIPLGVIGIRDGLRGLLTNRSLREGSKAILAGAALALPLYYGNGLLFGMHGEIKPSQYPAGWYTADRIMIADPRHDRALFLPWHQYLRLSFVRNVNSVVATPAPSFFSVPVLVSANPELSGIPPPSDPEQRAIAALVKSGAASAWAPTLAGLKIKYILVAREVDWEWFAFLDRQRDLVRIGDYDSLVMYRNTLLP